MAGAAVLVVVDGVGGSVRLDRLDLHSHAEPLLVWAGTSTFTLSCADGEWIVPPGHGMWVPAGVPHAIEVLRAGTGTALAFDPSRGPAGWTRPTAVRSDPLVVELVGHLGRLGDGPAGARERAEAVLFDVLEPVPATSVALPVPTDERLRAITDALLADPADGRELAHWAHEVGAGVRTLSRLFTAQTGLTFGQWRTAARVRAAITLLARGTPVGTTARRVGFAKPAAFAAAFRRVTGRPPTAYRPR